MELHAPLTAVTAVGSVGELRNRIGESSMRILAMFLIALGQFASPLVMAQMADDAALKVRVEKVKARSVAYHVGMAKAQAKNCNAVVINAKWLEIYTKEFRATYPDDFDRADAAGVASAAELAAKYGWNSVCSSAIKDYGPYGTQQQNLLREKS